MVEGGRRIGAAGVLHRRGGRAAVVVSVDVAGCVRKERRWRVRRARSRRLPVARSDRLVGAPEPVAFGCLGACRRTVFG